MTMTMTGTALAHPQAGPVTGHDRMAEWLLLALIVSTTLLQKFNLSWDGENALPVNLPIMLGIIGLGVLSGRLVLHTARAVWFFAFTGILLLTQLLGGSDFSFAGLSLLLLIHAFYTVQLRSGAVRLGIELEFFQKIMTVIAAAGTIQFFLQFIIPWEWAYLLDTIKYGRPIIVFQSPTMNNLIPLGYGGSVYKSNGFFLNEPSFLCQFLSIAVIIELVYFRNLLRLTIFGLGIAVSFSGTGLLVLLALTPFYLLQQRQFLVLTLLAVLALAAPVWVPLVGLEHTLDRIGEFSNPNSSAHARFISPFWQIRDFILLSLKSVLIGNGSGSIIRSTQDIADYEMWDPTWAKLVFEYGLVGVLAYLPFVFSLFVMSPRSGYLKAALALVFFIMGGNLASTYTHILILAMLAWPASPPPVERKWTVWGRT